MPRGFVEISLFYIIISWCVRLAILLRTFLVSCSDMVLYWEFVVGFAAFPDPPGRPASAGSAGSYLWVGGGISPPRACIFFHACFPF